MNIAKLCVWCTLICLVHSVCKEQSDPGCDTSAQINLAQPSVVSETTPSDHCLSFTGVHAEIRRAEEDSEGCPESGTFSTELLISSLIYQQRDGTPYLGINWGFSKDIGEETDYLVQTENLVDASSPSKCKVYSVRPLPNQRDTLAFSDGCVLALETNSRYRVNISDPETGARRSYCVFTPDRINAVDSSSPTEWRTILVVTLDDGQITVYLTEQPGTNSGHYELEVKSSRGSEVHLENTHIYLISQNKVVFNTSGDTTFTISLYFVNSISEPRTELQSTGAFQADNNVGPAGMATSTLPNDSQVQVTGVEPTIRHEIIVIIATICAVAFIVLISIIIFIIWYRRRSRSSNIEHYNMSSTFTNNANMYGDGLFHNQDKKDSPPTVLLLYSYDSQPHLVCVQSLALFLQNSLGCVVLTDFWATQEIAERGIELWLEHKICTASHIVIVCSSGVRFKSCTSRQNILVQECEDTYIKAMKILQTLSPNLKSSNEMVVYFSYSSEWDIPASLEDWPRYKITEDIDSLLPQFECCNKDPSVTKHKFSIDAMKEKIQAVKDYMESNPNWLHSNLRPSTLSHKTTSSNLSSQKFKTISDLSVQNLHDSNKQIVTVEHNLSSTDLVDSDYGSGRIRSPNLPAKRSNRNVKEERGTSLSCLPPSPASSVEDLERDVRFMLNPAIKTRFYSTPGYLMDSWGTLEPSSLVLKPLGSPRHRLNEEKGRMSNGLPSRSRSGSESSASEENSNMLRREDSQTFSSRERDHWGIENC